jgi:hypothetical protein
LETDRWVNGIEFMPGDRGAVRAATFSVQSTGQWLATWTPWHGFAKLPDGVAYRLPAGTRVIADVHYRVGNQPVADAGTVGLFFTRQSDVAPSDLVLEARQTSASRGGPHVLRSSVRLTNDSTLWALRPDITDGITSIELSARRGNGSTEIVLLAQNPPATWPTPYILKSPLRLVRGTELKFLVQSDVVRSTPVKLVVSRY